MAGDAIKVNGVDVPAPVSIHTRHEWRVMRFAYLSLVYRMEFQSTPAMNGG